MNTTAAALSPSHGGWSGSRGRLAVARRALAAVIALSWLTLPGFGIIDLLVTWDPAWNQVLEAGWGLFMTVFVAVPFVAVSVAPRITDVARAQLLIAAAALSLAGAVTLEWRLGVLVLLLVGEILLVAGVPGQLQLSSPRQGWPLLLVTVMGSLPWLAYTAWMWRPELQRATDADYTLDIDHLSVQGAFGVAVVALALLASFWPRGRAFVGLCAGGSACYLGLVSWAWPRTPAALPTGWSIACVLWGILVAVLAVTLRRR